MLLKPNWQRGKKHEYCSSRRSSDIIFERVQKNIPDQESITPSPKKKERTFMPKQNKLAVLGVAEFVERAMIVVIGLGVVTKIKWQKRWTVIIGFTNGALGCITKLNKS